MQRELADFQQGHKQAEKHSDMLRRESGRKQRDKPEASGSDLEAHVAALHSKIDRAEQQAMA